MKILIIINDGPYGTEKAFNALRLANRLGKAHQEVDLRIHLMDNGVGCALANQVTPNGYYNIERMIKLAIIQGTTVKICESCLEARGMKNLQLIEGTAIGTMAELAEWVVESTKVITF